MKILVFILEEATKTVIGLTTTALAGLAIWIITLRNRSKKLEKLLENPNRMFLFYYRGDDAKNYKKWLIFNPDGTINDGKHHNECYWKIKLGLLEIYTNGNKIYSKFRWDKHAGRLVHTNDPALPSVMGQYILPLFIPAGKNKDIYLNELDKGGT